MSPDSPKGVRRRSLIGAAAAGAAVAPLGPWLRRAVAESGASEPAVFTSVEDIYRRQWRWDRVVKVSHTRANCISACSWDAYVRDGLVWREEQNRIYEASNPEVPDFNPRGCQKGACWSEQMYSPMRLLHPMRRVGPRGAGRWQRISWDEAYRTIADAIIDAAVAGEVHRVVYDHGTTNLDFGPDQMWEMRFFSLLGSTELDSWGLVGDEMMGAIQSFGMQNIEGSADDWFLSDYIVVWMGNPVVTRIPEAHFLTEARYNGSKLVVIAPDYSATATKADAWLPVQPRTDAALALAMAQVIVSENLYKAEYVTQYTDLPLLVREDNGHFLRAVDLGQGGRGRHEFYVWDEATGRPIKVPGSWDSEVRSTLMPAAVRPALAGRFEVTLQSGARVGVRTAWSILLERLAEYTPEAVASETGIAPDLTRQIAREFAAARAPMIFSSWGAGKGYHSDLEQRAKILLCALAGSHGRPGGGYRVAGWYTPEAWVSVSYGQSENFPESLGMFRHLVALAEKLHLDDDVGTIRRALYVYPNDVATIERLFQDAKIPAVPAIPWFYRIEPAWREAAKSADGTYPRPLQAYLEEALGTTYANHPYMQKADVPRVYVFTGVNPLRRMWRHEALESGLFAKMGLIVGIGPLINYSMQFADIVLPAAGWYEKLGLKYTSTYVPYLIVSDRAVEPLGESKDEFVLFGELARMVSERAKARGTTSYNDLYGRRHDLGDLYDRWSFHGSFPPTQEGKENAFDFVLRASALSNPLFFETWAREGPSRALAVLREDTLTLQKLRAAGAVRIRSTGKYTPINGVCAEWTPGKTITPHRWFIDQHMPFPTATGRIQMYIDHPWYLEADEAMPRYRSSPKVGGDYPFRLIGGHTRWSIHSQWQENPTMLRLQRGEPVLHISVDDARRLRLDDHELVEVYNDLATVRCRVRVASAMQPRTVLMYHAWQPFHFPGGVSDKALMGSPIKPIHVAGDYPQLNYRVAGAQPGHCPRDTRVGIRKIVS